MDSTQGSGLNLIGVRAAAEAGSWSDAIEIAGALLTAGGVCTNEYVQAMAAAVRDSGPYMVIAPGVAMPHARPEDGVLQPGTAIVTLAAPVEFGSPANDPVDLVIAFAALDKNAHLETLQRITELLMNETALNNVRAATTDDELWAALSGGPTTVGEAS